VATGFWELYKVTVRLNRMDDDGKGGKGGKDGHDGGGDDR
jgi:hypothetical protein